MIPFFAYHRLEQRRYARKNSSKAVPWHQTAFTNDSVITVDNNGWVRLWEVNASRLAKSLNSWRSIVGGTITITFIHNLEVIIRSRNVYDNDNNFVRTKRPIGISNEKNIDTL